jgi:hypothetical protein
MLSELQTNHIVKHYKLLVSNIKRGNRNTIRYLENEYKQYLGKLLLEIHGLPEIYKGDMVNGERHGKGCCIFVNGDMYEGDWISNRMHGWGEYYGNISAMIAFCGEWKNNNWIYEGEFYKNMFHGLGKYIHYNLYMESDGKYSWKQLVIECQWNNGRTEPPILTSDCK